MSLKQIRFHKLFTTFVSIFYLCRVKCCTIWVSFSCHQNSYMKDFVNYLLTWLFRMHNLWISNFECLQFNAFFRFNYNDVHRTTAHFSLSILALQLWISFSTENVEQTIYVIESLFIVFLQCSNELLFVFLFSHFWNYMAGRFHALCQT